LALVEQKKNACSARQTCGSGGNPIVEALLQQQAMRLGHYGGSLGNVCAKACAFVRTLFLCGRFSA